MQPITAIQTKTNEHITQIKHVYTKTKQTFKLLNQQAEHTERETIQTTNTKPLSVSTNPHNGM
jgi:hypothetical protein